MINLYNEPKAVKIVLYEHLGDNHDAVDIGNFTQPDPDDFTLEVSQTIAAGDTIELTASSVFRIPPIFFPCSKVNDTKLRAQAFLLNETPNAFTEVQVILSPYRVCLIDGSVTPAVLSELDPELYCWEDPNSNENEYNNLEGYVIRGVFEIDEVFDFFGLSPTQPLPITMDPGAEIRVKSQGELILRDVDIYGCSQMWKGIRNRGRVYLERVEVRDAEFAVESYTNSALSLRNNNFVNNFTGVHIPEPPAPATINQVDISSFAGNSFFTDSFSLLPPYAGQQNLIEKNTGFAGVWVHRLPAANLSGFASVELAWYNTYHDLANGIIARGSNIVVKNSLFEDIVELPGASYPYAGRGIYAFSKLYSGPGSLVQEGIGSDPVDDATFLNCHTAILAEGVSATIRHNRMEEVHTGVELRNTLYQTLVINDNRIEAMKYGIFTNQNYQSGGAISDNAIFMDHPDSGLDVFGMKFDNSMAGNGWNVVNNTLYLMKAELGIFARNTQYPTLLNNTVHLDFEEQGIERYFAFTLEGAFGATLDCNAVLGNVSGQNYKLATGIDITGSSDVWAACNDIDDTRYGIRLYGMCDGSQLRGNLLDNHWHGLLMGRYVEGGGADGNAFLGTQTHFGNRWPSLKESSANSSDDRYGAVHLSDDDIIISYSKFIVDEGENDEFMPEVGLLNLTGGNPNTWFDDEINQGTSFSCALNNTCPTGAGAGFGLTEMDYQVARSLLQAESYPEAQQWTASRHLYRRLLADPDLIAPFTAIDTFYQEASQKSYGKHEALVRDLAALFELDSVQSVQLGDLDVLLESGLLALSELDSLLTAGPSYSDSLAYVSARDQWLDSLLQATLLQDSLFVQYESQWTTDAADYFLEAGNLPDTLGHEENQRIVREILLDRLEEGDLTLDSLQVVQLEAIAAQCPLSGGDAVFEARALLGKGRYADEMLCAEPEQRRLEHHAPMAGELMVVPNPNKGQFQLILPIDNGSVQIRIYDLLGRIVIQSDAILAGGPIQIDASGLTPGAYHCSVVWSDGKKFTARILIQK